MTGFKANNVMWRITNKSTQKNTEKYWVHPLFGPKNWLPIKNRYYRYCWQPCTLMHKTRTQQTKKDCWWYRTDLTRNAAPMAQNQPYYGNVLQLLVLLVTLLVVMHNNCTKHTPMNFQGHQNFCHVPPNSPCTRGAYFSKNRYFCICPEGSHKKKHISYSQADRKD